MSQEVDYSKLNFSVWTIDARGIQVIVNNYRDTPSDGYGYVG